MIGSGSRLAAALGMLALAGATAVGCGTERKEVANLSTPPPPQELTTERFPSRGMTVRIPQNWRLERRRAPGVFRLSSGQAQIAAFAYRRREPLPEGREELADAETRLLAETRKRDLLWTHVSSRRLEVDGNPAIELVGVQRISRQRLHTRSVHVFVDRAEYVFEALAPRESFRLASRRVLTPMLRSARLTGRITVRPSAREREQRRREEERLRREQEQQQEDQGTAPDQGTTQGTTGTGSGTSTQGTTPQGTQP